MVWHFCVFGILRDVFRPTRVMFEGFKEKTARNAFARPRGMKKASFYAHISANQFGIYQSFLNRAFALSPTLAFKSNDIRLPRLVAEAVQKHGISELDFEMMRLQYIFADECLRQRHRSCWVETAICRKQNDFFPDPWEIIAGVFAERKFGADVCDELVPDNASARAVSESRQPSKTKLDATGTRGPTPRQCSSVMALLKGVVNALLISSIAWGFLIVFRYYLFK